MKRRETIDNNFPQIFTGNPGQIDNQYVEVESLYKTLTSGENVYYCYLVEPVIIADVLTYNRISTNKITAVTIGTSELTVGQIVRLHTGGNGTLFLEPSSGSLAGSGYGIYYAPDQV